MAPPKGDRWGPGTRVPAIVASPLARRGFVDHTQYDTTSILRTIEQRWNLAPLGARDAKVNSLVGTLDPNLAAGAASSGGTSPTGTLIIIGALVALAIAGLGTGLLTRRRRST